jgi:hypothetical protein
LGAKMDIEIVNSKYNSEKCGILLKILVFSNKKGETGR